MVVLLFLLVVSLLVIIAGLFLSSPGEDPSQRQENSYRNHWGAERRIRERSYAVRREMLRSSAAMMPVRARGYVSGQVRRARGNAFSLANAVDFLSLRADQQAQWLGFLLMLLSLFVVLCLARTRALSPSLVFNGSLPGLPAPISAPANSASTSIAPIGTSGASKALVRINQLDVNQYANQQDYNTWAYSTCSTAAMTEVINAYGHHYRIADILKVEAGIGEITPDLGLLEPHGIDRTVAKFGFKTMWFNKPSLDQVIAFASQGHPVIVSFPPDRWEGGHLLVVRGGDKNNVYLAD
ncbi:MAG TPA: C39 family peptidase, partial [Ktedonobacteraceae bacterium]